MTVDKRLNELDLSQRKKSSSEQNQQLEFLQAFRKQLQEDADVLVEHMRRRLEQNVHAYDNSNQPPGISQSQEIQFQQQLASLKKSVTKSKN